MSECCSSHEESIHNLCGVYTDVVDENEIPGWNLAERCPVKIGIKLDRASSPPTNVKSIVAWLQLIGDESAICIGCPEPCGFS
jgi:hypothetical protein